MTTLRLVLAYDGSRYAGWQRQSNALAIQQVVEDALSDLLDGRIVVHGAGRTDAGVHALAQVAHLESVDARRALPLKALVHGTNHRLPPDIRVRAAQRMADGFHARKSTAGKTYVYRLWPGRVVPPTWAPTCVAQPRPLDFAALRTAARSLAGRHDFSAFALAGGSHRSAVRRLFAVTVDTEGEQIVLRFAGEGFLRGMVRSLIGTLLEVGSGDRPPGDIVRLLAPGTTRDDAGPTAPAHGLCLEHVVYPARWQPLDGYRA
ncbi:MAG: tRNA pseudouridine(38-40) synthase TruA [Acidobacteriota bacterium]